MSIDSKDIEELREWAEYRKANSPVARTSLALISEVERLRKALEDLLKAAKESHVVNRETTATLYAAEDMARKALTQ